MKKNTQREQKNRKNSGGEETERRTNSSRSEYTTSRSRSPNRGQTRARTNTQEQPARPAGTGKTKDLRRPAQNVSATTSPKLKQCPHLIANHRSGNLARNHDRSNGTGHPRTTWPDHGRRQKRQTQPHETKIKEQDQERISQQEEEARERNLENNAFYRKSSEEPTGAGSTTRPGTRKEKNIRATLRQDHEAEQQMKQQELAHGEDRLDDLRQAYGKMRKQIEKDQAQIGERDRKFEEKWNT